MYGRASNPFKQGLKVKTEDEYSNLKLTIAGVEDDSLMIVQLLNSSDAIQKEVKVVNHVAQFNYVKPGQYYVRAFIDNNGNGVWDTGDYDADRQAEAVYYYPREIDCKEKWDVTQVWNVNATKRFLQKPLKITKQKPDAEKKLKNRNAQRAKELGIPYNQKNVKSNKEK